MYAHANFQQMCATRVGFVSCNWFCLLGLFSGGLKEKGWFLKITKKFLKFFNHPLQNMMDLLRLFFLSPTFNIANWITQGVNFMRFFTSCIICFKGLLMICKTAPKTHCILLQILKSSKVNFWLIYFVQKISIFLALLGTGLLKEHLRDI